MFTGIIEEVGKILKIEEEGTNKHFTISCPISHTLKVDQSVAHNGVCLTVVSKNNNEHVVTAIKETLDKSNLGSLFVGDEVNIERSVTLEQRLDGHMVQGHVDTTAICENIQEEKGSWLYTFRIEGDHESLMVEKGSISINGTSLTVFNIKNQIFSVAIIPFTYENTVFKHINVGSRVNIEFDMMGKYIINYLKSIKLPV